MTTEAVEDQAIWHVVCRWPSGLINHVTLPSKKAAAAHLAALINERKTCTLTHTIEDHDPRET